MKKITLILFVFISLISLISALQISLDSVINLEDLTQIDNNLDFIKTDYGADIKFIIEDSENPVTKEALYSFSDLLLFQNNEKKGNSLVFYNKNQNKLRFVTFKECDFVYNYFKQLKEKDFIKNILDNPNPSNDGISNMFLQISINFKDNAESLYGDTCSTGLLKLRLRDTEYSVPSIVLGVTYAISQNKKIDEIKTALVLGYYITEGIPSGIFDFLPFVDSPKKKFYNFLQEKTDFSKDKIDDYYRIMTSKGNIIINNERPTEDIMSTLFHERVHKVLTEKINSKETQILIEAQIKFLKDLKKIDMNYNLIGQTESSSIYVKDWQELYAHMAMLEKYPFVQHYDLYIDEEVYKLFASNYPDAYRIYQRIFNLASD